KVLIENEPPVEILQNTSLISFVKSLRLSKANTNVFCVIIAMSLSALTSDLNGRVDGSMIERNIDVAVLLALPCSPNICKIGYASVTLIVDSSHAIIRLKSAVFFTFKIGRKLSIRPFLFGYGSSFIILERVKSIGASEITFQPSFVISITSHLSL